jgi:hypothetical protein
MRLLPTLLLAGLTFACAGTPDDAPADGAAGAAGADVAALDAIGRDFVVLGHALGRHDPPYVDAYYGPDSLKAIALRDSLPMPEIRARAESLLTQLGPAGATPAYQDSLVRMRHDYLRGQLTAMVARVRIVSGERLPFDEEASLLFGVTPPSHADAHFDSLLAQLDSALPGRGALAERFQRFRARVTIPPARVDTVFKRAIAECRARTAARIELPAGERFDLEYVTGTSWNAYNWYKGGFASLIQVNTDLPIAIDRAIDLACHEGYPGHHVYNALIEQTLVRERGWVEFSLYPLFSPQSLIAEGSANLGIDMAFPEPERTIFERDSLFPLAGLDPELAERNAQVRRIYERLNFARNAVARRYLNGEIDRAQAERAMTRYWLSAPDAAAKTVRFIDEYRSYVINYNLGRDLVQDWVARQGTTAEERWRAYEALLRSPAFTPPARSP